LLAQGVEERSVAPPWIFVHCTNIVDKSLKVLFFGLLFRWPLLEEAYNSAIFGLFSLDPPLGNFSSDALVRISNFIFLLRTLLLRFTD